MGLIRPKPGAGAVREVIGVNQCEEMGLRYLGGSFHEQIVGYIRSKQYCLRPNA